MTSVTVLLAAGAYVAGASAPFMARADTVAEIYNNRQMTMLGGTTAGGGKSTNATLRRMLNELIGTKFKVISGYPGSMESIIAMERGEVDGRYSPGWAGPEANKITELVATGQARLLAYLSPRNVPGF